MAKLSIIPQQFSFNTPTITDARGDTIRPGLDVTIRVDTYKADKEQLKKDLAAIFAEVLEYFD